MSITPQVRVNGNAPRPDGTEPNSTFALATASIALSLASTTGISSLRWEVSSAPAGSTCAIATAAPTTPFSTTAGPLNVAGTYLFKAIANDDADSVYEFAVTVLTTTSLRVPARGERGQWDPAQWWSPAIKALAEAAGGGGGGGAPTTATYGLVTANGSLPNARVFTAGAGITLTDAGAGSTLTWSIGTSAITNTMIANGAITVAKYANLSIFDGAIAAAAAIAGTKISPDFGAQTVQTTGTVTTRFVVAKGSTSGTSGRSYIDDNDNSCGASSYVAEIDTTNATVTTIATISPPFGSYAAVPITAVFTAIKSDGSSAFAIGKVALIRNNSGTYVQVGATATTFAAIGDACDATIDVSGGEIRFRVTGIAATTYRWAVLITDVYRTNAASNL